jgi:CBS-domain-containing membrane protein
MARGLDPNDSLIGEVMTTPVKTVEVDVPIDALIPLMQEGCLRRLPVVDGQGRLVGLITLDDVLMLWAEQFSHMRGLLKRETPRSVAEESLSVGHR